MTDFTTMTVKQLRATCKDRQLKGYYSLNKQQLITLLQKDQKLEPIEQPFVTPIDRINKFINEGHLQSIEDRLSDTQLRPIYFQKDAMVEVITTIRKSVEKYFPQERFPPNEEFIIELAEKFIPPGLKGDVRGRFFNLEIATLIGTIIKPFPQLRLETEKNVPDAALDTIPDWYVVSTTNTLTNTLTNKYLVGYNQLTLWGDVHIIYRGTKYVTNDAFHLGQPEFIKLIAVVCHKVELKQSKGKLYKLFSAGLERERLFYPGHLGNYIRKYFELP